MNEADTWDREHGPALAQLAGEADRLIAGLVPVTAGDLDRLAQLGDEPP